MQMIGYHYTSENNWNVIQKEGLKPYRVESLVKVSGPFKVPDTGIWLYAERQRGLSHLGCILWQAVTKKTENIVLLEVTHNKNQVLNHSELGTVEIEHDLDWKGFMFHEKTPVHIVLDTVHPKNIKVVGRYDISTFADIYDNRINNEII